jgi:hypothetical protein
VETDGGLYMPDWLGKLPLTVTMDDTRKLAYLPTEQVLRDYDKDKQVLFHPLSEYVTIGESDVFKLLKMSVRLALVTRIAGLMETLAILGTSTEFHDRMNSNQIKLLESMAGIDDKSVSKLRSVLDKGIADTTNSILGIFMTRDDELDGNKYPRVCNITFPIVGVLNKAYNTTDGNRKVFDIDVRKKTPDDIKIWLGLFNYVLPGLEEKGTYSRGSAHYAPYLGALLESYYDIQSRLNLIVSEFSSFIIPSDNVKIVDLKWYGMFKSGSVFNDLPNLSGNKGGVIEAPKPTVPKGLYDISVSSSAPSNTVDTLYQPTPTPFRETEYDVTESESGGMSLAEWRRLTAERNNQPPPPPQYQRGSNQPYHDSYRQPSYPQNDSYRRPLSARDLI